MIVGLSKVRRRESTTMAERKRMTADEVVSYLLEEDGADFLRESLKWVVRQLDCRVAVLVRRDSASHSGSVPASVGEQPRLGQ